MAHKRNSPRHKGVSRIFAARCTGVAYRAAARVYFGAIADKAAAIGSLLILLKGPSGVGGCEYLPSANFPARLQARRAPCALATDPGLLNGGKSPHIPRLSEP